MSITACRSCGVPKLIALMHRWRDDGILESKLGGVRGVFVERDVFAGTLERLEEKLGIPLDDIIIDAKRRDAKIYVDDILSGLLGRLTRFPLLRRIGYLVMIQSRGRGRDAA